jgi:hypothetical protein
MVRRARPAGVAQVLEASDFGGPRCRVIGQEALAILISRRPVTVRRLPEESATETVKCAEPFAAGVPEMTPDAGLRLSPAGSAAVVRASGGRRWWW